MKFCTNCGTENTAGNRVCTNCGQAFQMENTIPPPSNNPSQSAEKTALEQSDSSIPSRQQQHAKKPSKKKKFGLLALLGLIILCVATHFIIKSMINPTKTIQAMDADFQDENEKAFLNHFNYDKKTNVDEKGFYDYIEDQSWTSIRADLLAQTEQFEKTGLVDPITDENGNKIIKIEKTPYLGGLYDKISFSIIPVKVAVTSDYNKVQFTTEDITIDVNKSDEADVGEFLPGKYKWKAVLQSDYGNMKFDGSFDTAENTDNNDFTYDLPIEPTFVSFTSNNSDATVYLNNKSTAKTIYDEEAFGPLPLDGSVTAHAVVMDGGKEQKTKKVKIDSNEMALDFQYIKDQETVAEKQNALDELVYEHRYDLESFYSDFRSAYESDFNLHAYNAVPSYIVAGTELETKYKDFFPKFVEDDEVSNHTNIVTNIKAIDDNTFQLDTEEDYTFYSHEDITIDYSYKKKYTIITSGDGYLIKAIDDTKISEDKRDDDY